MSATTGDWVLEVLTADDRVARAVELTGAELEIGRAGDGLAFPDDQEIGDGYVRLRMAREGVEVRADGEGSGVWLRVRGSDGRRIVANDQVWLGSQVLVAVAKAGRWSLHHYNARGELVGTHEVPDRGLFVGRGSELVLDPSDRALSRRHAQFVRDGDALYLYDRGAHNGTYLRLTAPERLTTGSEFRLGMQHLRIIQTATHALEDGPQPAFERALRASQDARVLEPNDEGSARVGLAARLRALGRTEAARHTGSGSRAVAPGPAEGPNRSEGSRPAEGSNSAEGSLRAEGSLSAEGSLRAEGSETQTEPSESAPALMQARGENVMIVIDSEEGAVTLEFPAGQTVLEAVQEAGLERGSPLDWECGDGGCGVCVLGVVEGADRMDPPDPDSGEMKTIQITEQVVPDPNKYRLACLARVRGTVRFRRLG